MKFPKIFLNKTENPLPSNALRKLILVCKIAQGLSNNVLFSKEVYLLPMNNYITNNSDKLRSYVYQLTVKGSDFVMVNYDRKILSRENNYLERMLIGSTKQIWTE